MRHRLLTHDIEVGATYRGGGKGERRTVVSAGRQAIKIVLVDACGDLPSGYGMWTNRQKFAHWVNRWRRLEEKRVGGAHG